MILGFSALTRLFTPACGLLLCAVLASCSEKNSSNTILAEVNGEKITQADVDFTLERTFAEKGLTSIDASLRDKVLESLISSKAMKQQVQKELRKDEQEKISRAVEAYKEELYVKEYLQRNVTPAPVTPEMVKNYYEQHPEQFGTQDSREFELLKAPANLDEKQRDKLIKASSTIKLVVNWQASAKNLEQEYGLVFIQGKSKPGLLDAAIDKTLASLKKGETSDAFFVNGQLHIIRLMNVSASSAKPLSEVSDEIRKKLAPVMLRDAVKTASDLARSKANVQITKK